MLFQPFYDPTISYQDNLEKGPFGEFANKKDLRSTDEPREEFLGFPVNLAFGIPAGPLLNAKFVESAFKKGFDICTYKTVRTRQYPCHQWPNVVAVKVKGDLTLEKAAGELESLEKYNQPLSITNSFGVPSASPKHWQKDMKKAIKSAGKGQVMIASFQGTTSGDGDVKAYIDDHVLAARLIKETGAKIIEINLSCPNEGTADVLCFDVGRTTEIVEAVKNEVGETPVMLKLAYFKDDGLLKELVKKVGDKIQGLAAINTIAAKVVTKDGKQALPGKGRERSGVCGKSIAWAGLEMVERLKKHRQALGQSFVIVGVGGVTEASDYFKYRDIGADAVQSATGAMWNPLLASDIIKIK